MVTGNRKIFILFPAENFMQIKFLSDIVSDIAGKQGAEILQLLFEKKDVNEFLLAKKLKLTINQIRNILYKLSNFNLVTFTRKKDRKKGWYTYFWTLDTEKALELLDGRLKKEVEIFEQQLKSRETKRFYACKVCKTELNEESALLHDFSCPECGNIYELASNIKVIEDLEKNINKIEKQRERVLEELNKIKKEKEKKLIRQANRAIKTKKKKRKLLRQAKIKEKGKLKAREKSKGKVKVKEKGKKKSIKKIKKIFKAVKRKSIKKTKNKIKNKSKKKGRK